MASETKDSPSRELSRRSLFKQVGAASAAAIAGAPLASEAAMAQEHAAQANPVAASPPEALETLTAAEADILEAVVARLIPGDQNSPDAMEARAAHYIDRAIAGPLRASRDAYADGLAATDAYALSSKGAAFAKLSPVNQDAVLTDMEKNVATGFAPSAATFFNLVRRPHDPGHVLRSLLRRPNRLSGHPLGGHRGRSAPEGATARPQIGL
jgi:gluconate 2-dehydrogenase gamma chain